MNFRIVPAGDSALVVEFEEKIDTDVNRRAVTLADAIQSAGFRAVRDVVPTYRAVAVYFDPLRVDYDGLLALIERDGGRQPDRHTCDRAPTAIPVCYGGELGPDLPELAAFARLTEEEVICLHTANTYRVFMLGFVAGFAYMGTVDDRIAMPRHSTPRVRVPVGSVGIAGVQTGIYPAETPGGWRLIGRTPVKPFDPLRAEPFLLKAGDMVQFYSMTREEYDRWLSE